MPTEITPTPKPGLGGLTYSASGDASSVFTHTQSAYLTYTQVSAQELDGSWPTAAETKVYFSIDLKYTVQETITDFNSSGSTSSLNSWQDMEPVVYSNDSSSGLGTGGYIHFKQGYVTRPSTDLDFPYFNTEDFHEAMVLAPVGQTGELVDDAETVNAFLIQMNASIREGGILYSTDSTNAGVSFTPAEFGWMPELLG
jgi:hypothetical protein